MKEGHENTRPGKVFVALPTSSTRRGTGKAGRATRAPPTKEPNPLERQTRRRCELGVSPRRWNRTFPLRSRRRSRTRANTDVATASADSALLATGPAADVTWPATVLTVARNPVGEIPHRENPDPHLLSRGCSGALTVGGGDSRVVEAGWRRMKRNAIFYKVLVGNETALDSVGLRIFASREGGTGGFASWSRSGVHDCRCEGRRRSGSKVTVVFLPSVPLTTMITNQLFAGIFRRKPPVP